MSASYGTRGLQGSCLNPLAEMHIAPLNSCTLCSTADCRPSAAGKMRCTSDNPNNKVARASCLCKAHNGAASCISATRVPHSKAQTESHQLILPSEVLAVVQHIISQQEGYKDAWNDDVAQSKHGEGTACFRVCDGSGEQQLDGRVKRLGL